MSRQYIYLLVSKPPYPEGVFLYLDSGSEAGMTGDENKKRCVPTSLKSRGVGRAAFCFFFFIFTMPDEHHTFDF